MCWSGEKGVQGYEGGAVEPPERKLNAHHNAEVCKVCGWTVQYYSCRCGIRGPRGEKGEKGMIGLSDPLLDKET